MNSSTAAGSAFATNWRDAAPSALIDHILATHHKFTRDELARLGGLGGAVRELHQERHPELILVDQLIGKLAADLTPHMQKEEMILFPFIEALENGTQPPFGPPSVAMPVNVMNLEHERAEGLLAELRCVTSGYNLPEEACLSWRALYEGLQNFEADLQQHIHLETNVLFPKALEMERG
ncbi:MAG TPA: hemerythrin domain-containing protein [Thermoanaerobaculia bacterium]